MNKNSIERKREMLEQALLARDIDTAETLKAQIYDIEHGIALPEDVVEQVVIATTTDDGKGLDLEEIESLKIANQRLASDRTNTRNVIRTGFEHFDMVYDESVSSPDLLKMLIGNIIENYSELVVPVDEVAEKGTEDAVEAAEPPKSLDDMSKKELYAFAKSQTPPIDVVWTITGKAMRAIIKAGLA